VRSLTGPERPWFAAGALFALFAAAGCGNQYRPVVTPITPSGPAPQPQAFLVAFSQPSLTQYTAGAVAPGSLCPAGYTNAGIVTLIDFSGDSIMAQATVGTGPLTFALDPSGSTAYSVNVTQAKDSNGNAIQGECTSTLSTVPISTTLQSNKVQNTTLPSTVDSSGNHIYTIPTNILTTNAGQYAVEPFTADLNGAPAIGVLTGSPPSLKLEIPVAPALINAIGVSGGQRIYAISQGNSSGGNVTWGQCDTPSSVSTNGEADGIDTATNTVTSQLAVGVCPVYGLMTADGRRAFVLNRGSGTVTVIDSAKNVLDTDSPSQYMKNATISVGAGPVYADIYAPAALLVIANYDDDSVSIIDVSINGAVQGYTDTANFGHVLATVKLPAGSHPAAVTVLQDGSRVYTANEGTGTVSVINLSSFTVEKTIPVNGHPRSIASTFNAPIGKVYTVAPDSPYVTVIRTDTDIVSSSILLQGNGVDLHTTVQYAGTSGTSANAITQSHSVGSGVPSLQ
jgi:YVTN family beta-propeller protein